MPPQCSNKEQYHHFTLFRCQLCTLHMLKKEFFQRFYLFLAKRKGRKKERERNVNVREKHQSVASCTHRDRGPNGQSRHVPWLRIELATFQFVRRCPTNWATWSGLMKSILKDFVLIHPHCRGRDNLDFLPQMERPGCRRFKMASPGKRVSYEL